MNDQKKFVEDSYIENFKQELESFKHYADEGVIAWVGLDEVLQIWEQDYNSEPNILHYDEEAAEKAFEESSTSSNDKALFELKNNSNKKPGAKLK